MSGAAEARRWAGQQQRGEDGKRLISGEKYVLEAIAELYNDRKKAAWPSQEYIAHRCMMTTVTVRGHVARLVEKGFLRVEHRNRRDRETDVYFFPAFEDRSGKESLHKNAGDQAKLSAKESLGGHLREKGKKEIVVGDGKKDGDRDDGDRLAEVWNENCGKLPKVRELDAERRRDAARRLKAVPELERWAAAIRALAGYEWARGGNGHKARTFDWLIGKDKVLIRIEEGIYEDSGKKAAPGYVYKNRPATAEAGGTAGARVKFETNDEAYEQNERDVAAAKERKAKEEREHGDARALRGGATQAGDGGGSGRASEGELSPGAGRVESEALATAGAHE